MRNDRDRLPAGSLALRLSLRLCEHRTSKHVTVDVVACQTRFRDSERSVFTLTLRSSYRLPGARTSRPQFARCSLAYVNPEPIR